MVKKKEKELLSNASELDWKKQQTLVYVACTVCTSKAQDA